MSARRRVLLEQSTAWLRVVLPDGTVDLETADMGQARDRVADYGGNAIIERLWIAPEWRTVE